MSTEQALVFFAAIVWLLARLFREEAAAEERVAADSAPPGCASTDGPGRSAVAERRLAAVARTTVIASPAASRSSREARAASARRPLGGRRGKVPAWRRSTRSATPRTVLCPLSATSPSPQTWTRPDEHGSRAGPLDILACSAGIPGVGLTVDVTDDEWRRVMSITLMACSSATAPSPGDDEGENGRIVNLARSPARRATRRPSSLGL